MSRQRLLPTALLTVICVLASVAPALAVDDLGDFQLEFDTVKASSKPAVTTLRKSGALQALVQDVNDNVALPRDIPIAISDEISDGPAYLPDVKLRDGSTISFIHIPGTFVRDEVKALGTELGGSKSLTPKQAMIYANEFVLAHEMGHALVDQLDLPITGKEEDAVDGFAAFVLVDDDRFGPLTAVSAAILFDAFAAQRGKLTSDDFADEHSILEQRSYQFLCWVYGSDPSRYGGLVGNGLLPKSRAVRCPDEWRQDNRSWSRLLQPYLKG